MTQNEPAHERKGGLRGDDKQQGDLTDQPGGQGIVRDQRGQDQQVTRSARSAHPV